MKDQQPRRLAPIDDEYQGPSWWHFSRLADAGRNPGMRRIALIGFLVLAVSLVTGILNVTLDWNGIPVRVGPIHTAARSPKTNGG